jgi:hypothetical protein
VSVDGAPDPLRQSLAVPAIELTGCTTSQANVARIVADLRAADGVKRVSLSSASKSEVAAGTTSATTDSGSAAAGSDCTQGNSRRPKFSLTIFYDAPATPATPAAATPSTTTPTTTSGTATTAGSSSTPTSTTGG